VIFLRCPACGEKNTGKVGSRQYYCWDCLIEFRLNGKEEARMFYVESDGTLVEVGRNQLEELGI